MDTRRPSWRTLWPAALVFLLILAFSAALLRGGRLRDMDLARLGTLEAATTIAESFSQDETVAVDLDSVVGWGVYTPDGTAIATWGSAPEHLRTARNGGSAESTRIGDTLRTVRPMMVLGVSGTPGRRSGSGGGNGMRRMVLVDWNIKTAGTNQALRIAGVAGLSLTALFMLVLQQRASIRLAGYRRDEERKARLVQLGMAARTLTHEIRNPLGIIKIQTALLKKTLGSEAAASLDVVDTEVSRLNALTERVREWLADPTGHPERFIVSDELEKLITRLPWEVNYNKTPEVLTLNMDRSLFATTMENLIRNAVESQDGIAGSPPPTVLVEVVGRILRLTVQDAGRGLPPGGSERLFDPFFTTKTQGSGVGLALARQLVEAAGGTLVLENRQAGGAQAIVTLPREKS